MDLKINKVSDPSKYVTHSQFLTDTHWKQKMILRIAFPIWTRCLEEIQNESEKPV